MMERKKEGVNKFVFGFLLFAINFRDYFLACVVLVSSRNVEGVCFPTSCFRYWLYSCISCIVKNGWFVFLYFKMIDFPRNTFQKDPTSNMLMNSNSSYSKNQVTRIARFHNFEFEQSLIGYIYERHFCCNQLFLIFIFLLKFKCMVIFRIFRPGQALGRSNLRLICFFCKNRTRPLPTEKFEKKRRRSTSSIHAHS